MDHLEDAAIISLYWRRDAQAIPATAEKYGSYCTAVARNILRDQRDTEECVNDTYLRAWNAMPPHRPAVLSAFLGKITRNLALNRHRKDAAEKRGGGEADAVFEELAHVVSHQDTPESDLDRRELLGAINEFLAALPDTKRRIFVCRYWYFDSITEIAERFGFGQSKVKMMLLRTRGKLLAQLEREEMIV